MKRIGHRLRTSIAMSAVVSAMLAASACNASGGSSKTYDISPIFPLSPDKCAKYNGNAEGSGVLAHCWVTKSDCERAAADWRQAMESGGGYDAIEFTC